MCVDGRRRDWAGFGSNKRGTPAESERKRGVGLQMAATMNLQEAARGPAWCVDKGPDGHRYRYLSGADGSGCGPCVGLPLPLAVWPSSCAFIRDCSARLDAHKQIVFFFFFYLWWILTYDVGSLRFWHSLSRRMLLEFQERRLTVTHLPLILLQTAAHGTCPSAWRQW
jgi:hypothetical protein